jgi:diguanylate cyclase (GGDEF)-like protein
LRNRRALDEEFERELARCQRTGIPLTLIILDLDHFKRFNDALGHLAGDDALRRMARVLDRLTRSFDTAARIGGEEFAVMAPGTHESRGQRLAERLRVGIEAEFEGSVPALTVSCGVAGYPSAGDTRVDLFATADRALYAAKGTGRNRTVLAEPGRAPAELASA